MKLLKTKFLSFIFSVLAYGSVLAPPPKNYTELCNNITGLFSYSRSKSGEDKWLPRREDKEILDFLAIPKSCVPELAIQDDYFFDENKKTVKDVLDRLSGLLSRANDYEESKRVIFKIVRESETPRFGLEDEFNHAKKEIPKDLLESRTFQAYAQAAGYSVDVRTGKITKTTNDYTLLITLLRNNFPGKEACRENAKNNFLERLEAQSKASERTGKDGELANVVVPPAPSEKTEKPIEQPPSAPQDDDKESIIASEDEGSDESETPSKLDPEEFKKEEEPKKPEIMPAEEDSSKSDLKEGNNNNLEIKFDYKKVPLEKIFFPLGAAIFLGLGFADKIKGCFVKKDLNRKLNKKYKRGFNRARTLCLAAGLVCLVGSFFVFSTQGFKKTG